MPESRTLTGHTIAMVKLADGGEVAVRRGESLPEDLAKGEEARLEKLGAFGPPRVANLAAQGARPLDAGALSPQLTLAANPEPGEDGPLLATGEEAELFTAEEISAVAAAAGAARAAKERADAALDALRASGNVPEDIIDRLVAGDRMALAELLEHVATPKEPNVNPAAPPAPTPPAAPAAPPAPPAPATPAAHKAAAPPKK